MLKKVLPAVAVLAAALSAAPAMARPIRVGPNDLASYWRLSTTELEADVPNFGKNMSKPTCVAVAYTIGSDGNTRDLKVLKMKPRGDLYKVALSVVKHFQYVPGPSNHADRPVRTYYVVPFNLPADKAARQKITHACDLPGFAPPQ